MKTRLSHNERYFTWVSATSRGVLDCDPDSIVAERRVYDALRRQIGTARAERISSTNFRALVAQSIAYAKTSIALDEAFAS